MKLKKTLASMICAALMVSLVGCSNQQESQQESAPGSSQEASVNSDASQEKEPITLKVLWPIGLMGVQSGVQSDPVSEYITEQTGITIDLIPLADGDPDGTRTKITGMIASNNLPDIIWYSGYVDEASVFQSGTIMDLTELVETNAPNMKEDKWAQAMIAFNKTLGNPLGDGKLYKISTFRGSAGLATGPIVGNYIRWDLYKELGYPEIESYDTDLIPVLKQMQELEPENANGQKTYAIGAWAGSGQLEFLSSFAIGVCEGVALGPDSLLEAPIDTNLPTEKNGLKETDSLFWRGVRFFNQAYQAGILDPDSFTQNMDQYQSKVNEGRYMMVPCSWHAGGASGKFISDGSPEKGYQPLPPLNGTDSYSLYFSNINGEKHIAIAKSCKYPERAMELLDFMSTYEFSTIANVGVEGNTWNMVDGVPQPSQELLDFKLGKYETADATAFQLATGVGIYDHCCGYAGAEIDPDTGIMVDFTKQNETIIEAGKTDLLNDYLEHYQVDSFAELVQENVEHTMNYNISAYGSLPEELKSVEQNLIIYTQQGVAKCVLSKDDAEFEKNQQEFIDGLDAYQVDDIFDAYYQNATETLKDLPAILEMLQN